MIIKLESSGFERLFIEQLVLRVQPQVFDWSMLLERVICVIAIQIVFFWKFPTEFIKEAGQIIALRFRPS